MAVNVRHCVHLKTDWISLFWVYPPLRSTQSLENNLKYIFSLLNIAVITVKLNN